MFVHIAAVYTLFTRTVQNCLLQLSRTLCIDVLWSPDTNDLPRLACTVCCRYLNAGGYVVTVLCFRSMIIFFYAVS
jgi:hypothetical protein